MSYIIETAMENEPIPVTYLNKEEFAAALRKGQGRAPLHVLHHGLEEVSDLILEACLHNQVYDQLSDSFRGDWLLSMVEGSAQYPEFRSAILKAVETEPVGNDLYQLFLMARTMALQGDREARKAFGGALFRIAASPDSHDWLGVEDWIDLEGADGLLQLARIYGQRLLADPDDRVNHYILDYEEYPQYKGILEEYSRKEAAIKAYWDYLEEQAKQRSSNEQMDAGARKREFRKRFRTKHSLQSILDDARAGKGKYPGHFSSYGKHATQDELEVILQSLLDEADEKARTRMLWVFWRVKIPRLDNKLLEWAEGENEELRAAAIAALAHVSDGRVHQLARKKAAGGSLLGADNDSLDLFLHNFASDDLALINQSLVDLTPGPDDAHSLGFSIRELAGRYDDPGWVDALLWVYENTPCGFCREQAVNWLAEHGSLSEALRFECQYDANEDIREYAVKPA